MRAWRWGHPEAGPWQCSLGAHEITWSEQGPGWRSPGSVLKTGASGSLTPAENSVRGSCPLRGWAAGWAWGGPTPDQLTCPEVPGP